MKALALVLCLAVPFCVHAESFFRPSPRPPQQGEVIYLLMPDRFARDSPGPDTTRPEIREGLDPKDPNFFHGGSLRGLQEHLDYLQHLGVTSIWLTPILKNRALQDYGAGIPSKAGYHGYWILDFTDVDPHFGTKADLRALIEAADARHLSVILDVVVNHTADVIVSGNGIRSYQYKFSHPYLDAGGKPFDDRDYIDRPDFPRLDPERSFPIPPAFRNEAERHVKRPEWLNDPTVYHNRGEASSGGESAQYGDISGLDDLFTEQPRVVDGMIDIYRQWIRNFGVHGFRLDTVKHVNNEFWRRFVPAIETEARAAGRPDFFIFGEVYDQDPAFISEFVHHAAMPSLLDFGFQRNAVNFAAGTATPAQLAQFFSKDAYYTTPTTNAYGLVTFISNHDLGRVGYLVPAQLNDASPAELVRRDELAQGLLFCCRGIPALYYGDEQGFTGKGGDVAAREDMFASQVPEYAHEPRLGGGSAMDSAYDERHSLYRLVQQLAALRRDTAALRSGMQVTRLAENADGVFAFSRIDPASRQEVVVIANNAKVPRAVQVPVSSAGGGSWKTLFSLDAAGFSVRPGQEQEGHELSVRIPALDLVVVQAEGVLQVPNDGIGPVRLTADPRSEFEDRWTLTLDTGETRPLEVAFGVRRKGETQFHYLGTSDSPPYRIFPVRESLPADDDLEFAGEIEDLSGHQARAEAVWQKPRRVRSRLPSTK